MPMIQLNFAPQPETGTTWTAGELVAEPLTQQDETWTDGTNRAIWPYTATFNSGTGHFENNGTRIRLPGTDTGVSVEGPKMRITIRMTNNQGEVKGIRLDGIVQANAATPGEWNMRTFLQGQAAAYVNAPGATVGALTVTDLGATVAPINNPIFTGDPRGPTPPSTDNDTSLATTAYVKAQSNIPGGFPGLNISGRMALAQLPAELPISYGLGFGLAFNLGDYVRGERMADILGLTPTQAQKNKALEAQYLQNGVQAKVAVAFTRAGNAWAGALVFPNNAPRIFGAETASPAILIEGARTNLNIRSTLGTGWNGSGASNSPASPDASSPTGQWSKLTATAGTGTHLTSITVNGLTDGAKVTASIKVKAGTCTRVNFYLIQGVAIGANYDLAAGTATALAATGGASTDKARIKMHEDGTATLSFTGVLPAGVTSGTLAIRLADAAGNTSFTATGNEFLWWDVAQIEQAEFHSSAIPTAGATANRVAESYNINNLSDHLSLKLGRPCTIAFAAYAPGTAIALASGGAGITQRIIQCSGGATPNWGARFYAGTYVCTGRADSNQTWNANAGSIGEGVWARTFLVWDGSQVRVYVNGTLQGTSPTLTSDTTITTADLGQDSGGGNALCGLLCPGAPGLGIPFIQFRALSAADVAIQDAEWAQELNRIQAPY